jgi:hypothetical protein
MTRAQDARAARVAKTKATRAAYQTAWQARHPGYSAEQNARHVTLTVEAHALVMAHAAATRQTKAAVVNDAVRQMLGSTLKEKCLSTKPEND